MIKVTTFLFFQFWTLVVLEGNNFLNKFSQQSFKIKDFRAEVKSYNKDIIGLFEITTYKYNRSLAVVNTSIAFDIDIKDTIQAIIQAYKFISNEYRVFPIHFQTNFCEALQHNTFGLQKLLECGNLTDCHFKKGVKYFICNFYPDPSRFPPNIPNGKYMCEIQLMYKKQDVGVLTLYYEIFTPMV